MPQLFKKVGLLSLCAALPAWASVPAATDPTEVSVPSLAGSFSIGATGIWLQPTLTNGTGDYANVATEGADGITSTQIKTVDPAYTWGYGFNLGYTLPETGNDINVSYIHLDTGDDDSVAVDGDTSEVFMNGSEIPFTSASANTGVEIDQVDLTFGQFVNVGCRLSLHPFAGLRYASIDTTITTTYNNPPEGTTTGATQDSTFNGIGPLAGMDASYYLGAGFGVVAHVDTAILAGNIDSSLDTINIDGGGAVTENNFSSQEVTRVAPVMDAKLGLNYTYIFDPQYSYNLSLEAGYQISNYSNVVEDTGGFPLITKTGDLGLNGPYFSLVYRT